MMHHTDKGYARLLSQKVPLAPSHVGICLDPHFLWSLSFEVKQNSAFNLSQILKFLTYLRMPQNPQLTRGSHWLFKHSFGEYSFQFAHRVSPLGCFVGISSDAYQQILFSFFHDRWAPKNLLRKKHLEYMVISIPLLWGARLRDAPLKTPLVSLDRTCLHTSNILLLNHH